MAKQVAATAPIEGPWALPGGWRWEALGSLGTWSGGGTPSKARPDFWSDGTVPWVSPKDMKRPLIDSSEDAITVAAVNGSSAKMIPAGSVLCVMRSGILRHTFPVAVNTIDVTLNQDMRALTPRSDVNARYLTYYLQFTGNAVLHATSKAGTTVNSIEASRLDRHPVPLVDFEGQRRIVARIDELFAEIEDGEAALARARDDLATWRKALLKAAVTGELTADWRTANPPTETGADLLARILEDRRESWEANPSNEGKRYKAPPRVAIDDERELPDGWTWASVDQIGEVVTGNTPPASDLAAYDGDVPFFTPGDLDAGFVLDSTKRTLGPSGLAKSRRVPPRSVLVTCIGATIGKVGFNARAGATNQQINTIIPILDDLAEYIFHYFDGLGRHLVIEGASSTTMPIINKGDFSRLPVPIPPIAEAREISRVVAARYADADAAQVDMKDARLAAVILRQSILAAAFRGELA